MTEELLAKEQELKRKYKDVSHSINFLKEIATKILSEWNEVKDKMNKLNK